MTYQRTYNRSSFRGGYRPGTTLRTGDPGRVAKPNRRPGACRECGETIPAGAGYLYKELSGAWSVIHAEHDATPAPSSAVRHVRRGRCEDAPCCGC